jgi:hypothetical protein
MSRTYPFYGKGIGFRFRLNPATAGVQVTVGLADPASVGLAYIREDWTIREDLGIVQNHIAECIAHILLTRPLEWDTLPWFGTDLFHIIAEPNTPQFKMLAEHYFSEGAARWEKRANIPAIGGMQWPGVDLETQQGILPAIAYPEFIRQQVEKNLVKPFVTERQVRNQEYPVGNIDANGHDYCSRYYGRTTYQREGISYIKARRMRPLPPKPDDLFYDVKHYDSWLLIAWKQYQDIRFWWVIADCFIQDSAKAAGSRTTLDNTGDPTPGTMLRMPSRTRVLLEMAA